MQAKGFKRLRMCHKRAENRYGAKGSWLHLLAEATGEATLKAALRVGTEASPCTQSCCGPALSCSTVVLAKTEGL